MARIIVIGGIESTFTNAQTLFELGEDIVLFVTRGKTSRGWEGVQMIDETKFSFISRVPKLIVDNHINDHIEKFRELKPDFIYSLGWQQIYSPELMSIAPIIGIHESLLPEGAGAVPIANAILHERPVTGITLFWIDGGIDTGPIIGQLQGVLDPRESDSTDLYAEAIALGGKILRKFVPLINEGVAPRITQDFSKRTVYKKIDWSAWPEGAVKRARKYPYV